MTDNQQDALEFFLTQFHENPVEGVMFKSEEEDRVINHEVILADMDHTVIEEAISVLVCPDVNFDKLHDIHKKSKEEYERVLLNTMELAVKDFID